MANQTDEGDRVYVMLEMYCNGQKSFDIFRHRMKKMKMKVNMLSPFGHIQYKLSLRLRY